METEHPGEGNPIDSDSPDPEDLVRKNQAAMTRIREGLSSLKDHLGGAESESSDDPEPES